MIGRLVRIDWSTFGHHLGKHSTWLSRAYSDLYKDYRRVLSMPPIWASADLAKPGPDGKVTFRIRRS